MSVNADQPGSSRPGGSYADRTKELSGGLSDPNAEDLAAIQSFFGPDCRVRIAERPQDFDPHRKAPMPERRNFLRRLAAALRGFVRG